jgi:NhaA family Na+:H+ antiporter
MRTRRAALAEFLHAEHAGSIALLGATAIALVWANSAWDHGYFDFWATELDLGVELTRRDWIGEGLMTLFFLVVGLEIRRELVDGELRDRRRAALPAIAAIGGMALPALLYVAIAGTHGRSGWGIPMATDIALAVGVLRLFRSRVSPSLAVFLLALAIVDDIGAILVIALFYTDDLDIPPLLAAAVVVLVMTTLRRFGVASLIPYAALGVALWFALYESGVHPTIAGVIVAFLLPTADDRVERALHPWTSLLVVPLFALSHAGVSLSADALDAAVSSRVSWAVFVGLVLGKLVGVAGSAWLADRFGAGQLPPDVGGRHLLGVAAIAGIGFTVSLFVTGLAFTDAVRQGEATIGVLAASCVAAVVGALLLRTKPAAR